MGTPRPSLVNPPPHEPLTRREREILAFLEKDLSNQEIADHLVLALSSVKWHVGQIYQKLGVNRRREAVLRARELGLLESPTSAMTPSSEALAGPAVTTHLALPVAPALYHGAALPKNPILPVGTALPTGTVTFLFTDIEGSTSLWERHPEQMPAALQIHNTLLRQIIEVHAGVCFKTVGDAFQAGFATAPQALTAAIEGQRALQQASWNELGPLTVRMGLHTGEAELDPGGDEYAVSHTKNRVSRIMSAAHGGQILLSAETTELVNHQLPTGVILKYMGENRLKGLQRLEHLTQVCAPGLVQDFPPLATAITQPNNLPAQRTSFIGRETQVNQVQELLRQHALVTLTGSGGVGKTRLSIQAAEGLLEQFSDGIWLVELAPISDPELVPRMVANVLGVREDAGRPILETLCFYFGSRCALLILDNCEHLVETCAALVDALLGAAPGLRVIASSRDPLGVSGEVVFRVPSLGMPPPGSLKNPEDLLTYESIKLFVDRAQAALPEFRLTHENNPAVVQICQRLDGIPLAIELAAGRVASLDAAQIANRLDRAFRMLTGGGRGALERHRTLRAAIDWSYHLLANPERLLLLRLAVFIGGWTLEAAEEVCSGGAIAQDDVFELLSQLVNKSMVLAECLPGGAVRYRLLETLRQYAADKLGETGEKEALHARHLAYFLRFANTAEPQLYSGGRLEWTQFLQTELDNIRGAIEWSYATEDNCESGLSIATAVGRRFMQPLGLYIEAWTWLVTGLEAAREHPVPPLLRARALNVLGWLELNAGDMAFGQSCYKESAQLCREIGHSAQNELSWALSGLAWIIGWENPGNRNEWMPFAEESIMQTRQANPTPWDQWYRAFALTLLATFRSLNLEGESNIAEIRSQAEEATRLLRQVGDRWSCGSLWILATLADHYQEFEKGLRYLDEALSLFEEVGDKNGMANTYQAMSQFYLQKGDYLPAILYAQQHINTWYEMGNRQRPLNELTDIAKLKILLGCQTETVRKKKLVEEALVLVGAYEALSGEGPVNIEGILAACQHSDAINEKEIENALTKGRMMTITEAVRFALDEN